MEMLMNYIGLEVEEKQLIGGMKSHHNIGGNDSRYKASLEIVPDEVWRKKLNLMQKLSIFWYTRSQKNAMSRFWKNMI